MDNDWFRFGLTAVGVFLGILLGIVAVGAIFWWML